MRCESVYFLQDVSEMYMYICLHERTDVCMYVCMYVCIHVEHTMTRLQKYALFYCMRALSYVVLCAQCECMHTYMYIAKQKEYITRVRLPQAFCLHDRKQTQNQTMSILFPARFEY